MSAVYVECIQQYGGAFYSVRNTLENDYGNTQCPLFSIADVQTNLSKTRPIQQLVSYSEGSHNTL